MDQALTTVRSSMDDLHRKLKTSVEVLFGRMEATVTSIDGNINGMKHMLSQLMKRKGFEQGVCSDEDMGKENTAPARAAANPRLIPN